MLRVEGMKMFHIRRSSLPLGFFGELLVVLYMGGSRGSRRPRRFITFFFPNWAPWPMT